MLVDINLLPQKERDRPVMLFAVLGILLVAILMWATFFFMAQSQTNQQAQANAEYTQVAAQSEAIRTQLAASVGMNEEQQLKSTVDWAEGYQFDTVPLLGDLVSRLPERGFFDSFSFVKPNTATLMIQFDTAREAAYYLAQLKSSELLASAKLDSVAKEELETAEEEDDDLTVAEEEIIENPRYLATYSLVYVDERLPAEPLADGTAPADGSVETPATEEAPPATDVAPAGEETPAADDTPASDATPATEGVPAEEETPAADETPATDAASATEEAPSIDEAPNIEETPAADAPAEETDSVPAQSEGDIQ